MTYLLDTNVCIPLLNGVDASLKDRLLAEAPSSVVLCSVVKAELYFGACNSARLAENLARVEVFCRAFDSLPFDDVAASQYGPIRAHLRREGRMIGANDLLIASICLAANVTLVTRNVDEFRRIPGLQLEVW